MGIIVSTKKASGLIASLKTEIKSGNAHTWVHGIRPTAPRDYFTHNGEGNRFLNFASFAPSVISEGVVFNLFSPGGKPVEYGIWGVYHGRFVELLLNHGGDSIESIMVSPGPIGSDVKRNPKPKPVPPVAPKLLPGTGGKVSGQALDELIRRLGRK